VDPRPGGRFYLWWERGYHSSGTYTELQRDKRVAFTWRGHADAVETEVHITLEPRHGGTILTLDQHGASSPRWSRIAFLGANGWPAAIENLQSLLETGIDFRVSQRPLLGISEGYDLNDTLAQRLGVTAEALARQLGLPDGTQGFVIHITVEGLPAHQAGLQRNDVLVRLAGSKITRVQDIGAALSEHRAGDRIEAEFYRGGELCHTQVTLAGRPSPRYPASLQEVIEDARAAYAALDAELDASFDGATEAGAGHKVTPDEWSAKEILAHLIATERDIQAWITAVAEGHDIRERFHTHNTLRLNAIIAACRQVPDLVRLLRQEQAITLSLAAALPLEAFERKYLFRLVAGWFENFPNHNREHFASIRAALAADTSGER
jgi:hypothetical protein